VFVELPLDVQYPYFMVEKEMLPVNLPRGLVGRVVFW
jgi:acetolactate synthase-like protein